MTLWSGAEGRAKAESQSTDDAQPLLFGDFCFVCGNVAAPGKPYCSRECQEVEGMRAGGPRPAASPGLARGTATASPHVLMSPLNESVLSESDEDMPALTLPGPVTEDLYAEVDNPTTPQRTSASLPLQSKFGAMTKIKEGNGYADILDELAYRRKSSKEIPAPLYFRQTAAALTSPALPPIDLSKRLLPPNPPRHISDSYFSHSGDAVPQLSPQLRALRGAAAPAVLTTGSDATAVMDGSPRIIDNLELEPDAPRQKARPWRPYGADSLTHLGHRKHLSQYDRGIDKWDDRGDRSDRSDRENDKILDGRDSRERVDRIPLSRDRYSSEKHEKHERHSHSGENRKDKSICPECLERLDAKTPRGDQSAFAMLLFAHAVNEHEKRHSAVSVCDECSRAFIGEDTLVDPRAVPGVPTAHDSAIPCLPETAPGLAQAPPRLHSKRGASSVSLRSASRGTRDPFGGAVPSTSTGRHAVASTSPPPPGLDAASVSSADSADSDDRGRGRSTHRAGSHRRAFSKNRAEPVSSDDDATSASGRGRSRRRSLSGFGRVPAMDAFSDSDEDEDEPRGRPRTSRERARSAYVSRERISRERLSREPSLRPGAGRGRAVSHARDSPERGADRSDRSRGPDRRSDSSSSRNASSSSRNASRPSRRSLTRGTSSPRRGSSSRAFPANIPEETEDEEGEGTVDAEDESRGRGRDRMRVFDDSRSRSGARSASRATRTPRILGLTTLH